MEHNNSNDFSENISQNISQQNSNSKKFRLDPQYIYQVGGAIRDKLLKTKPKDIDYVVVHYGVDDMLKAGFFQVGREFPVFIHPKTKCEYALARIERKNGVGYRGFEFVVGKNISIEDDLRRRDLTINAMAQNVKTKKIIDPYGGRKDLRNKTLRHVSEAFAEDPVRILRLARFSARYVDFSIAPETIELAQKLVNIGEVKHLSTARVWIEISRSLKERRPSKFFVFLQSIKALEDISPLLINLPKKNMQFSWNFLDSTEKKFSYQQQFCILLTIIIFELYIYNLQIKNNAIINKNNAEVFAIFYQWIDIICENFGVPLSYKKIAVLYFKALESISIPQDFFIMQNNITMQEKFINAENLKNYVVNDFFKSANKILNFFDKLDFYRRKDAILEILPVINLFLNYLLNRIFSAENSINIDFGNKMQNIFDLYDAEFNASTIAKTLQNEGKSHLIKQILQEEKLKFFSQKLV